MAVRKRAKGLRAPILCFVGPPGVGKTSLGKSIARAMGRKFIRMSLGGIRDEAEIRGHRRPYVGALPRRVLQTMKTAGETNPVFMLDEIDKVGADFRGDPSSALLEVLDPEQNNSFSDHYLEVPYDLSRVIFITTGNVEDTIIAPLRDRMEIIRLPGYTEDEKMHIATGYLLPRQLKQHGLEGGRLVIGDETLKELVRHYTREAGVRNLEREIGTICRKVARAIAEGKSETVEIAVSDLSTYLGPEKFDFGLAEEEDQVGAVTGVSVAEYAGDVPTVAATVTHGTDLHCLRTGQPGQRRDGSAETPHRPLRTPTAARAGATTWGGGEQVAPPGRHRHDSPRPPTPPRRAPSRAGTVDGRPSTPTSSRRGWKEGSGSAARGSRRDSGDAMRPSFPD